jgi:hypothetical protein
MPSGVLPLLPDLPVERDAIVPRVLHQVWVGSPVPTWVQRNWDLLDTLHPDWTILRWTDDNSNEWPLSRLASKRGLPHVVVLADLIRIEQVWKHGGVYLDSDMVPLRPLDRLAGGSPWIASGGWEGADATANNAAFGFPQRHPFLAAVWADAAGRLDGKSVRHLAGPLAYDRALRTPAAAGISLLYGDRFPELQGDDRTADVATLQDRHSQAYAGHLSEKSWYGANHSVHNTPTFIMAVPWVDERKNRAESLAKQTSGKIVWDTDRHAFHTWRSVMKAVGDGPAIVIEDDVRLVSDWRNRIEAVIAEHRDEVVQFFSMRNADLTIGSRSEPGRTFMMNQCYYLPAGAAKALLDFTEEWNHPGQENPTGYDVAMAEWMKINKQRYWLHVPSLVDHEPWTSEINSRRPRNRQSLTFEEA